MKRYYSVLPRLIATVILTLSATPAFPAKEVKVLTDGDGNVFPVVTFVREDSSKYFIKETHSTNLFPWAVTVLDHAVWAVGELNFNQLHGLAPDSSGDYPSTTTAYTIPSNVSTEGPPGSNGPFLTYNYMNDTWFQSDLSMLGEEVVTDEYGRIWFAQSGAFFSSPSTTNYSRVVSFTPPTEEKPSGEFCVYNVPDDNAEVIAMEWDADRDLLWFTQSSLYSGVGAIVSFKPSEMVSCANEYVWQLEENLPVTAFTYDYCTLPNQQACFTKYPLPADYFIEFSRLPDAEEFGLDDMDTTGSPAFLVAPQSPHPDAGTIWYTLFLGGALGRLDPDAQGGPEFVNFPIGDFPYSHSIDNEHSAEAILPNNSQPWDIDVHPVTGDIVFTGFYGGVVGRFDMQQYLAHSYSGECESMSGEHQVNPCMQLLSVPRLSSVHNVHQFDFDKYGNAWFTVTTEGCIPEDAAGAHPHEPASIGFINSDWTEVIYFDHLNFSSVDDAAVAARIDVSGRLACEGLDDWFHTGITTDDVDGRLNLWFTDSFQQQIRHLKVKPEYIGKDLYCEIRDCS